MTYRYNNNSLGDRKYCRGVRFFIFSHANCDYLIGENNIRPPVYRLLVYIIYRSYKWTSCGTLLLHSVYFYTDVKSSYLQMHIFYKYQRKHPKINYSSKLYGFDFKFWAYQRLYWFVWHVLFCNSLFTHFCNWRMRLLIEFPYSIINNSEIRRKTGVFTLNQLLLIMIIFSLKF